MPPGSRRRPTTLQRGAGIDAVGDTAPPPVVVQWGPSSALLTQTYNLTAWCQDRDLFPGVGDTQREPVFELISGAGRGRPTLFADSGFRDS